MGLSKCEYPHQGTFKEHIGNQRSQTTARAYVSTAVSRLSLYEGCCSDAICYTVGSVHDHVINFKVDLDIAGTSNSLRHTYTVQEEVTHPWFDDEWGQTVMQQRIVHKYIENENDALLKYSGNFRGEYSIVNRERTNQWGVVRGYAIRPGYSPIYNVGASIPRKLLIKLLIPITDYCGLKAHAQQCELGSL